MNVTDKLKARLEERRRMGLRKYGGELTDRTNIDFISEAIDEALDQAAYLQAFKDKLEDS